MIHEIEQESLALMAVILQAWSTSNFEVEIITIDKNPFISDQVSIYRSYS